MRLISPIEGLNYLGRVEVRYNGTWGTVCDSLDYSAINVICAMLNFRRATCSVRNARMGRGSGELYFAITCKLLENIMKLTHHHVTE